MLISFSKYGRRHCREGQNSGYQHFLTFTTLFLKGVLHWVGLYGKELHELIEFVFYSVENIVGKGKKMLVPAVFPFPSIISFVFLRLIE